MPQPPTLKIVEIFPSIQGEGLRQGEPTVFIRLSGCNLKCRFCDTKYAWKGGREFTAGEILDKVRKIRRRFPASWVSLTGGEPLLQEVEGLAGLLKEEKLFLQVETNGTVWRDLPADWFTLSPKPPHFAFRPEFRTAAREVKLVVTGNLALDVILRLRREFPREVPIFLQPCSASAKSMKRAARLLRRSLNEGCAHIRVSVQLHKIYGVP